MVHERNENTETAQLPFVGDKRFWSVAASGDWCEDSRKGAEYARLYVAHIRATGRGPLLSWIVKDMIKAGSWTGIEAAFLAAVGQFAQAVVPDDLTRERVLRTLREGNGHHADDAKPHRAVEQLKRGVVRAKAVRHQQCRRNKLS